MTSEAEGVRVWKGSGTKVEECHERSECHVMSLVVLTQNVWGGAGGWPIRKLALARAIATLEPDVVGLQEIHVDPGADDTTSQAHELLPLLPGYRATFAAGRVDAAGGREGVALLTRVEMHAPNAEKLTLDRTDPWEGESQRVVLHARIEMEARPIDLYVTHLSLSRTARTRTIAELLAFVERTRGGDAIVMGDLNATPDEPVVARLDEHWVDAWASRYPRRRGGTWPSIFPRRRIDYVFVPRDSQLVVETCHRLPFAGSDHLGVVAHLESRSSTS